MGILTTKHQTESLRSFIDSVANTSTPLYAWWGRPVPWPDDANPPEANNSLEQIEQSIYRDISYGKRVTSLDVAPVVTRYDWTANTVYSSYNQDDPALDGESFYVLTDALDVFKCIYNNAGQPSLIKPSLRITAGTFTTSDGYVWKYMFTIPTNSNDKFTSNRYFPVSANDDVVAAAVPGSIDYVLVTDPGLGYSVHDEGYLSSFVNSFIVELPQEASPIDNLYVNSAIYLYAGPGSNQIRRVVSYDGASRLLRVDSALDSFITVGVANVAGTIDLGETLVQSLDVITLEFSKGFFNQGDTIIQSDTGANGIVSSANSTFLRVQRPNAGVDFSLDHPVYNTNDTGTVKTGTVTINTTSTTVVGVATTFPTSYANNDYIRVGPAAANNIRRVVSITDNTHLTVDSNFTNSLVANAHYSMGTAFEPASVGVSRTSGEITQKNLTGLTLSYANAIPAGVSFIQGEKVDLVNSSNVSQGANGTMAYSNASTIILSDVSGTWLSGLFILGESSSVRASISSVDSFPTVTIESGAGRLISGFRFDVLAPNGAVVANGTSISSSSIPNQDTQYLISPAVTIIGDGTGATAYSRVETGNTGANGIAGIFMIDGGQDYTTATATVSSNSNFGSGAVATPVIGPLLGHGADPVTELGSIRVTVSVTFDVLANELFRFPVGSYRRVGLIRSPKFDDVTLHVDSLDRWNVGLSGTVGSFAIGEVVLNANGPAAGVVGTANSTLIQLTNVSGNLVVNTAVLGLSSNATATITSANVLAFQILSDNERLVEVESGATARIEQVIDPNTVKLTDLLGLLSLGDDIVEPSTNVHAVIRSVWSANNSANVGPAWLDRFNDTARVTLSSNTAAFTIYEEVIQSDSLASGTIFSLNDLDLFYSSANGTFSPGDLLHNSGDPSSNAVVTFANNTLLRLTSVSGAWTPGQTAINNLNIGANIDSTNPVLSLVNVSGAFEVGPLNLIGQTSGAVGRCSLSGTVVHGDLVRNSGEVIYHDNLTPVPRTVGSRDILRVTIRF